MVKYKVQKKQNNSSMCLVCGLKNDFGTKASFYELENGELVAEFSVKEEHQSYPGRLHGGIIASVLDETLGRTIMISEPDCWPVTMELKTRYLKPVPLCQNLRAVARIKKNSSQMFEAEGEMLLPDGQIAVTASGKYMKMHLPDITTAELFEFDWHEDKTKPIPQELEI
ncbi:MAG: PaaI family thioesterase [Bacillota bacterium]|jgi:uncharacterized protein (TIGR00369 family)